MISKENENLYNIILSIFLGILFVILLDQCFDKPRIFNVYADKK